MLPAQRDRIDNLYLQQRSWDFPAWQQHYLHHPLMGWLSRRLIWQFTRGDEIRAVIPHADGFCDSRGEAIVPDKDCRVSLWHPLDSSVEEIQSWREWLESHAIVQPFKQAHREVYLLTDAERNTATYSNRFAAHILKQHQFNVLAAGRRWAYNLVGCWDGSWEENARLCLPQWNLRAEFWVDGVEDGTDTTEAGVYHYVSTDQVRFYRADAPESWREAQNSVPLTEIPPLVLSEVFRDVDLFVSVASVGNDPQWADSGPDVEGRSYWEAYSFGDLSATAKTRKAVLERLVPRLKIAQRCEITDKFLIVHGDIRSYKIHLGSGNILMTPDNQYLCIVTARGKADQGDIFLPFEGDNMLAIILSKAFMLAEDTKIKDSTILSQIK